MERVCDLYGPCACVTTWSRPLTLSEGAVATVEGEGLSSVK